MLGGADLEEFVHCSRNGTHLAHHRHFEKTGVDRFCKLGDLF